MKVLFAVSAWAGHYSCMVPLGWALQAAGHEVRVAVAPCAADGIARSGLTAVPVLDTLDLNVMRRMAYFQEAVDGQWTLPGLPPHPLTGEPVRSLDDFDIAAEGPAYWAECAAAIARSYDGAVGYARSWRPDLVVFDLMSAEGALAARLLGVPSVYFPFGLIGTVETEPGVDLGDGDPSGSWPRYGQPAFSGEQIEYVIDVSPQAAAPPVGNALRMPLRYVPYNGPAHIPDWLRSPGPGKRVCILWGNSATGGFGTGLPVLRHAVDAAAGMAQTVFLAANTAQVEALDGLPDNVRVLRNFPLHLLLALSDLVIHHGSANPAMNAAAVGTPQLSLALNDEQRTVSGRMAATGASRVLPGLAAGAGEVRDAVRTLLQEDSYRRAAQRVAAEIAARPTPAQLVPALEQLARTGRLGQRELDRLTAAGDLPAGRSAAPAPR
ncbi:nucleotide disphospho-sugar-binding domain-containing protein [Streptomyces sp. NPDC006193]|uniref:nucleotide disphospho-sugar-binding domain-containing protein n=1 Tax=Streptomyces sp. NPDC006193 TaxID=3155717 RepID=UPI0033AE602D